MSVALILFGLLGFTVCVGLYLVELALHIERNPEPPTTPLSVEELLQLVDGPHAGVVIDLAEHQIRRTDNGEDLDDVA